MGETMFFFRGHRYLACDPVTGLAGPGGPRRIAGDPRWPGFEAAGFGRNLRCALPRPRGVVHVFRSRSCLVADVERTSLRAGVVHPIAALYPGLAGTTFAFGVDAAVDVGDGGTVFLFRGGRYVRYDVSRHRIAPGYPAPITGDGRWPGLAATGFGDGVDAALNRGDGSILFFRGDRHLRCDLATGRVREGYPRTLAAGWPGLADNAFTHGVHAVLMLGSGLPGDAWWPVPGAGHDGTGPRTARGA